VLHLYKKKTHSAKGIENIGNKVSIYL